MRVRRGALIVLEGPDKSGKSTQARLLVSDLRSRGFRVVHTREPGGSSFSEAIRNILLRPGQSVDPVAELLLYEASRAQHTHEILLPALRSGAVVVCERYTLATLVYQGFGRGLPLPMIRYLNRIASRNLEPALTLVLDIPEGEFNRRKRARRHDRLEEEPARFRARVHRAYRRLARSEPRTRLVPATQDKKGLQKTILALVLGSLGRR